jgi:hypothetical protein
MKVAGSTGTQTPEFAEQSPLLVHSCGLPGPQLAASVDVKEEARNNMFETNFIVIFF